MSKGGFSKGRLNRLRDVMTAHVERGDAPGLVMLLERRGEMHVDAIGVRSLKTNLPMQRDSIFRISSMTKPLTAAAALLLVEECKLRLDEPVDRLLPELANRTVLARLDGPLDDVVPARRAITLRDLLTFRIGTGILLAPPDLHPIQRAMSESALGQGPPEPQTPPAPDEWMRRLGALPLMAQPGDQWMYSTGSDVLGVLIARASGKPFEIFLRDRLLEPLGMKDTAFNVPSSKLERFVTGYWTKFGAGEVEVHDLPGSGQWSKPPAFPSGAGGLTSTVDDFARFSRMLLSHGLHNGARILSRPSVELMTRDHLTPDQKARSAWLPGFFDTRGWGFGLSIVTRRDDVACAGSFGWDGGLGTSWIADPREHMTTLLFTQRAFSSPELPVVHADLRTGAYHAIDD